MVLLVWRLFVWLIILRKAQPLAHRVRQRFRSYRSWTGDRLQQQQPGQVKPRSPASLKAPPHPSPQASVPAVNNRRTVQRNPANTRHDAASWPQPRQTWSKRRKRRRRRSTRSQVMPLNGVRGHAIASTTAVAVRPVTTIYSARAHFSAMTAILTPYPLWAHASCAW
eukprot:COSAG05_NODE_169_length_15161_cov_279.150644_11_plen_167_part_00